MAGWMDDGRWTGLDIGSIFFTTREIESLLSGKPDRLTRLLKIPRWHHGIDKGYLGRAVFGPTSLTHDLVSWINEHRFDPAITKLRRKWSWQQFQHALEHCSQQVKRGNTFEATVAIRASANALMSWQLEAWNLRDASFGRIGTQFEHLALLRGDHDIVRTIRNLSDLHDPMVRKRMSVAPSWVLERHERSFRARRLVNEELGKSEDMRDTLRVCSVYESRKLLGTPPPYPEWLAIPDELSDVTVKVDEITAFLARYVAEPSN
jgi:hypothetical protein